jgi:hypothetical protein
VGGWSECRPRAFLRNEQLSCSRYDGEAGATDRPRLITELPVALPRRVRLGDVSREGKRIGADTLERLTFRQLAIDDATAVVVHCGSSSKGEDGRLAARAAVRGFPSSPGPHEGVREHPTIMTSAEPSPQQTAKAMSEAVEPRGMQRLNRIKE